MAQGENYDNDSGKFLPKLSPVQRVELMEAMVTQALTRKQGAEFAQRTWGISITPKTAGRVLADELEKLADESKTLVSGYRAQQSMQIDTLTRIALTIAIGSRCSVCNGEKIIPVDRLDKTLGNEVCPKCEGSGRNENETTRLQAVNTIKSLMERKAKLFGMDAPVQSEITQKVSVALDVGGMSDDQLADELKAFYKTPAQLASGARAAGESSLTAGEPVVDAEVVETSPPDRPADAT